MRFPDGIINSFLPSLDLFRHPKAQHKPMASNRDVGLVRKVSQSTTHAEWKVRIHKTHALSTSEIALREQRWQSRAAANTRTLRAVPRDGSWPIPTRRQPRRGRWREKIEEARSHARMSLLYEVLGTLDPPSVRYQPSSSARLPCLRRDGSTHPIRLAFPARLTRKRPVCQTRVRR